MENETMNPPQQPVQPPAPTAAAPAEKKGHGGLIALIVLVVIILAAMFFLPKQADMPADGTTPTAQDTDNGDLSSLEAELDATQFEGVSEGL